MSGRAVAMIASILFVAYLLVTSLHLFERPTAVCRDGHISYSRHHSGTCSWHGGVAKWEPKPK